MKKLLVSIISSFTFVAYGQLGVTVNSGASQLAQQITGSGVTVSNATLNCSANGAGTFTYTGTHLNLTGGILLTTGNATTAAQPYTTLSSDQVGNNGNDPDLTQIQANAKKNLCRLEFDFVPICPSINFKYVFASEEYPTFVGSVNDAFGVFLTGPNPGGGNYAALNVALLPNGQPVSINNVNAGSNATSFVPNYSTGYHYNDIVYDGFTTAITSTAAVTPCQTYHIKFAIADASDQLYDSGVFLQSGGLSCTNAPTITPLSTASSASGSNGTASVSVTGNAPLNYTWQPGGQNTAGITGQPPGTYTCVMTFSSTCTTYTLSQIVTIASIPGGTITPTSNTPCVGTTLSLSTVSGTGYSWTGPGGFTSAIQSPTISPASVANSGVYSVTVTSASGPSTGTVNVTVNALPSVTMPGTQTLTCASPSVSLIASALPSTCTPVWSGGVCAGAGSYTASACSAGIYTLTVTNPATGCSTSGTVAVSANAAVPTATASNSGSLTCITTTAQVVATTTSTPVSYTWTGPGAVSGAATSAGTVSVGGTYTCVIMNTVSGCSTTITTNVPVNTTSPAASITSPATITCAVPMISLSGSPSSGVTYTWTGAGIASGANTSAPSVNQAGVYTLNETSTVNGCTASTTVSVVADIAIPAISLSPNSLILTCSSPILGVTATSTTTPLSYSWLPAPVSGGNSNAPVFDTPGNYTVTASNGSNGCSNTAILGVTSNTIVPTLTVSPSQTITCASPSVSISGSATPSTCTPVWTGGVCASANAYTTSACSANIYTLTVTDPSSGCSNSAMVSVSAGASVPTATASNSGSLTCVTATAEVVATTTATPVSYTWTGPGTVSGAATSNGTVSVGGTYTCVIMNTTSGCSATITTNVPVDTTPPAASVTAPATITCAAPTITLSGLPSSGVTYTWTGAGIASGANTASPSVSQAGTYTLVETSAVNGCTASVSANVSESSQVPVISLSQSSVTLTCSSPTLAVTATSTTTPLSYSWSPAPASGGNTNAPVFNAPGIYTVTANNSLTGCSNTAVVTVSTNTAAPLFTITPSQTLTCLAPSVVISTTVALSTGMTFNWAGPGIMGSMSDSVTVNQSGIYTVTVTSAANGCTATASSTVSTSSGLATVTITPFANSMLTCSSHTVILFAPGTAIGGSLSYTWSTGSNTTSTGVSNAGIVTVTVTNTASGCTATAQYAVTSNTTAPSLSVSSATLPCGAASSTVLSASSTNTNVTYNWSASGGGSISSGPNTANPNVSGAGNYNVTITDSLNGCTTTSVVTVTQSSIHAAFTPDPTSGVAPLPVNFANQSSGATGYLWNFGNGSGSGSANSSTTYTASGTYTVMLVATAGGCVDTAYAVIVVDNGLTIEVPNVFTPNGDNINDVFTIKSTGVKELSLIIFNRWGEKVCDASGEKAGWNGNTVGGAKVPDGTYFFIVKATGYDEKEIDKQGTVNLYR